MLDKTRDKILKRLMRLPNTHVDTSIILEPENTDDGRDCRKFIQKLGYNYRGKFSIPMLGELMIKVLSSEDYSERVDWVEKINSIV